MSLNRIILDVKKLELDERELMSLNVPEASVMLEYSKAVSLKRIADILEKWDREGKLTDVSKS